MVKNCLVSCFLLFSSLHMFSQESLQAQFPDTMTGRRASAYFIAFNSGDENDMSRYLRQNYSPNVLEERPVEARTPIFRQIKNDLGTLEPIKVVKATEETITVAAQAARGQWVEVAFEFEPGPAFLLRVMRIHLLPEAPDLNAPTFPISEAEMLQELEDYI
ncbi:hypothetical protein JXO59_00335, partial [candidate division KSB1 bacterium]|nr:hypothetical protein [candidate division KSB1 bacterium]